MRGHIRKRGSAWSVYYDRPRDPVTGRRRKTSKGGFRTKQDAERWLASLLTTLDDGSSRDEWVRLKAAAKILDTTIKYNQEALITERVAAPGGASTGADAMSREKLLRRIEELEKTVRSRGSPAVQSGLETLSDEDLFELERELCREQGLPEPEPFTPRYVPRPPVATEDQPRTSGEPWAADAQADGGSSEEGKGAPTARPPQLTIRSSEWTDPRPAQGGPPVVHEETELMTFRDKPLEPSPGVWVPPRRRRRRPRIGWRRR